MKCSMQWNPVYGCTAGIDHGPLVQLPGNSLPLKKITSLSCTGFLLCKLLNSLSSAFLYEWALLGRVTLPFSLLFH